MIKLNRTYLCFLFVYFSMLISIAVMADVGVAAWVFKVAALFPYGDKLFHLVLSGILSFLLNGALHCRVTSLLGARILVGNLMAYLFVLAEETTQFWMTTRNVDIWDVIFAIIGIHIFGFLASHNMRMKGKECATS